MTIRTKPPSCDGCQCRDHGTDFSAIDGTGSSGVMLIGEASGLHEAHDQLPFRPYAPAGSVLERVFREMSLSRQMFSITNVLRCQPRNNWLVDAPWEFAAIAHCRPNLEAAIAERRPRCIVTMGNVATQEITGLSGDARGVSHLSGYVLPDQVSSGVDTPEGITAIPVLPIFHTAYLRRGKISHMGYFARVLQRALNISRGIVPRNWIWNVDPEDGGLHDKLRYQTRPQVSDADRFAAFVAGNPQLVVVYDLETSESVSLDEDARAGFTDTDIRLVQFYVEGLGAIAIPWERDFFGAIKAVLHSPNTKCGHNVWLFDNKVLRAVSRREGLDFEPRGIVHDTLAMFHHWQPDLPAHLQFAASFIDFPFPWKHLAATCLPFYGCVDVHANHGLYRMLERNLRREGLWSDEDYMRVCGGVHA